jgi:hypothetical protein
MIGTRAGAIHLLKEPSLLADGSFKIFHKMYLITVQFYFKPRGHIYHSTWLNRKALYLHI